MTIFGPDVSTYQTGLDLSQVPDVSFVIAKVSEGTYYTDAAYQGFRSQTARLGKPFVWYHLVSTEPAADQVAHTLACVGDPRLPGMIDCEPSGSRPGPSWGQIQDYAWKAVDAGLNLRLLYLPEWYWDQIGQPDLEPLSRFGLVASRYGPTPVYPGDGSWPAGYGGRAPVIWQYTNAYSGGGKTVDLNAYTGTVSQLETLFEPYQGDDMSATFASGQVAAGAGARTVICPPPSNTGANWGNVWISFGADFGDAQLRIAGYVHGSGWEVLGVVTVPAAGDRVNPFGGPVPAGLQKVSVTRITGTEDVPVGWLVEAQGR